MQDNPQHPEETNKRQNNKRNQESYTIYPKCNRASLKFLLDKNLVGKFNREKRLHDPEQPKRS